MLVNATIQNADKDIHEGADVSDESWIGFNDEPATEDSIGAQPYIEGFVQFIKHCPTPMTTAIQGDWGSGKTSALRAIKKKLGDDAWVLEFNTWQYSQFKLGEQLVFSLIGGILTQLNERVKRESGKSNQFSSRSFKKKLEDAFSAAWPLLEFGAKLAGVGGVIEALREAHSNYREHSKKDADFGTNNLITSISILRTRLQDLVSAITEEGDPARIYIFIDDLDRLEPEKAVEVMEALKVFLNLRNCVFVLAIDFAVVLRGVRSKYGADFSEDKARSFFDKIIQVPFNLPVRAYQIRELLEEGLKKLGADPGEEALNYYEELVINSIGTNPRSIKRILNTFALILEISATRSPNSHSSDADASPKPLTGPQRLDVFALLCLQTGYQKLFVELVRHIANDGSGAKFLENALHLIRADKDDIGQDADEDLNETLERWGLQPVQAPILEKFLDAVSKIFGNDKGRDLDDQRIQIALDNAAITAVGLGRESESVGRNGRVSKLEGTESRFAALSDKRVNESTRANIRAFEDELTQELGPVVAGDTGRYWGYVIGEGGKSNTKIGQRRFAELHYHYTLFSVQFGNFLSQETVTELFNEAKNDGFEVTNLSNANYTLALSQIASEGQARKAARIVARAYQLAGQ